MNKTQTKKTTKKPAINQKQVMEKFFQVLSVQIDRAKLFSGGLGLQYDGERDLYQALGFRTDLKFDDYFAKYQRQAIAKAVIDRPVAATWRGNFELIEAGDDETTPLEKAWKLLDREFKIFSRFVRADKLSGIGSYGVLFLGLSDVNVKEDNKKPVTGTGLKLAFIKPLTDNSAVIDEWDTRPNSKRFGLPKIYKIKLTDPDGNATAEMPVHHSRIIHIAWDMMESDIFGTPQLKSVFNNLMNIEKIVGGDAESFWRVVRQGYQAIADKDAGSIDTTGLQDVFDEFEHNLRRVLPLKNIEMKALEQQVFDPQPHLNIQIEMISAVTGIPKRILTGSERGELASSEDKNSWFELIQARREEMVEPVIIRATIDRFITYGILPPIKDKKMGYTIKWQDLWAKSDKEKAEIARIKAEAIKAYLADPIASMIMPPGAFFKLIMGLTDDELEQIEQFKKGAINEEDDDFAGDESE